MKNKLLNCVASIRGKEKMLPFRVSRKEHERNQGVLSLRKMKYWIK